jgi:hypothetical protein
MPGETIVKKIIFWAQRVHSWFESQDSYTRFVILWVIFTSVWGSIVIGLATLGGCQS